MRRGRRCHRRRPIREGDRPARRRTGRWPQLPGSVHVRRRTGDRPRHDARDPRRPAGADGTCAGRRPAGRARPGDAGVRPGRSRRHRDPHGTRRPHAGRRDRLADAQVRPHDRPAAVRRHGDRRRRVRAREPRRERRALLGRARRGRQLRHRDGVRVPAEPRRAVRDGGPGVLADGGVAEGPALLPRVDRRRAGRAHDDRGAPARARPADHPARPDRQARRGGRGMLRGAGRGRRAGPEATQGLWPSGARPLPADALRRSPGAVRPLVPGRALVLLPLRGPGRALRRCHRHRRRPCA